MLLKHFVVTGAYELPKVAKERITDVPSKYNSHAELGVASPIHSLLISHSSQIVTAPLEVLNEIVLVASIDDLAGLTPPKSVHVTLL